MYSYIKGKIVDIVSDAIIVDNRDIGYVIHVSNPYAFKKDSVVTVYVHLQVKEDDHILFGFSSKEEKALFLKLILVKGIGCKTAIGMLAVGDIHHIIDAIENKNVTYLKKIPGIGPKAAQQIILDLQGKFAGHQSMPIMMKNDELEEAGEVLVALGYRKVEVDKVLDKLKGETSDTNGYVKKALSMLVK